eukprot:TRINITY_DN59506_c0_g1_i1.p1 TRINITY_DN59506_c0_g1~~TRINITY_DN59506_c0_g1_i1.p1  ORF type:complete len:548 (+),score=66.14 TRINITY_DN59506_c0_g1_i1:41-1684(+)
MDRLRPAASEEAGTSSQQELPASPRPYRALQARTAALAGALVCTASSAPSTSSSSTCGNQGAAFAATMQRRALAEVRDMLSAARFRPSGKQASTCWTSPRTGRAASAGLNSPRSALGVGLPALAAGAAWRSRRRPGVGMAQSSRTFTAGGVAAVADVAGEWALRASVLGNPGAVSGHLYLDPSGQAAYVSDGVQVVGRGVGRWLTCGGGAAVELDLFQYAAAAANIPEVPHRFRALWRTSVSGATTGDWYFVPGNGEAPRLVGSFDAAPTAAELLPDAVSTPEPFVDSATRDMLMAALDVSPSISNPHDSVADKLKDYRVGHLPTAYYIPNWVDEEQERELLHHADVELNGWEMMKTRSSQEWGAGDRCGCGRGLRREPLPAKQQKLADALAHLGFFDGALFPMNSVRLNAYVPGQGIHPHCDGPVYYPTVGILSLASPCIMDFYPQTGTEDTLKWDQYNDVPGGHKHTDRPVMSVFLEPRSLLMFSHDLFWHHRHGISSVPSDEITGSVCNLHALTSPRARGEVVQRSRRVSLTMRHLLPRCACQG